MKGGPGLKIRAPALPVRNRDLPKALSQDTVGQKKRGGRVGEGEKTKWPRSVKIRQGE